MLPARVQAVLQLSCVVCERRKPISEGTPAGVVLAWSLGPKGPSKIVEVTLMRPIHGIPTLLGVV